MQTELGRSSGRGVSKVCSKASMSASAHIQHVPEYRLRPDDLIDFIYRLTRDETKRAYQLNVGDEIRIESFTDKNLDRPLIIQPDGTITLPLLGQVRATRHSVAQLREDLEQRFQKYYKVPSIVVTPIRVNTKLDDLRAAIGGRSGFGPQVRPGKIMPDGGVALPAIGTVPAQGLTLAEFKQEMDARYRRSDRGCRGDATVDAPCRHATCTSWAKSKRQPATRSKLPRR